MDEEVVIIDDDSHLVGTRSLISKKIDFPFYSKIYTNS